MGIKWGSEEPLNFRISPYEWNESGERELSNNFNISNALWFGIGSFLCQGCDILPKWVRNQDASPSTPLYIANNWLLVTLSFSQYTFTFSPFIQLCSKCIECGWMFGKSYGWKHQTLLSQLIRPCEPRFPGLVLVSDWLLMSGRTLIHVWMNLTN